MSPKTTVPAAHPHRRRLPSERHALTHKFSVAGHEGYITVGLYEDGLPGEIFIAMAKEGSTVSGLMDAFAIATSLALQYGVPLKVLCEKFTHTRFEPSGYTLNPEIRHAKSVMDYIFRWLALKFLPPTEEIKEARIPPDAPNPAPTQMGVVKIRQSDPPERVWLVPLQPTVAGVEQPSDAPSCQDCGAIMVRSGSCYKCMNCGSTSGCS